MRDREARGIVLAVVGVALCLLFMGVSMYRYGQWYMEFERECNTKGGVVLQSRSSTHCVDPKTFK